MTKEFDYKTIKDYHNNTIDLFYYVIEKENKFLLEQRSTSNRLGGAVLYDRNLCALLFSSSTAAVRIFVYSRLPVGNSGPSVRSVHVSDGEREHAKEQPGM